MYTYSDFTVLIALNYMNKAQTEKHKKQNKTKKTTRKQREETGQCPVHLCLQQLQQILLSWNWVLHEAIHSIALRPNSAFSMILQEKEDGCYPNKNPYSFDQILTAHFKICGLPPLTSTVESHTRESPILLPGYFINSKIRKSSQKFGILNWCDFSCDIVWRASQIFFTQLPNNLSIRFGLNCACVVHRFIFSFCLFVWQITLE